MEMAMIATSVCLYLFAGLLIGAWMVLFVRAYARRRLARKAAPFMAQSAVRQQWSAIYDRFPRFVSEIRCMRLIKKSLAELPPELNGDYKRFVLIHRISILLVGLLILFALSAYKFCK